MAPDKTSLKSVIFSITGSIPTTFIREFLARGRAIISVRFVIVFTDEKMAILISGSASSVQRRRAEALAARNQPALLQKRMDSDHLLFSGRGCGVHRESQTVWREGSFFQVCQSQYVAIQYFLQKASFKWANGWANRADECSHCNSDLCQKHHQNRRTEVDFIT